MTFSRATGTRATKRWFTALAVTAIVVGACGSSSTATGSPAASSAAPAASATAAASTAASAGAVASQAASAAEVGPSCLANYKGTTINVGFSAHPLADSLIQQLPDFTALTGITAKYTEAPEADFRAKLNTELQAGSGAPDVFMTGPSSNWQYAANKWAVDLQPYVDNPTLTSAGYDFADLYPAAVNVNRWTGVNFQGAGQGSLWAIPINEEAYSLAYRKDIFAAAGVQVPTTTDELIAAAKKLNGYVYDGKKVSGFVARGINNWGILVTGYGSFLFGYGGTDLNPDGTSAVNSPTTIEATSKWAELMQYAPQDVSTYDWQQAQSAFAAGNVAMILYADHMSAVFEDPKQSQVTGKVGYALEPAGPAGRASGIWVWSLGMAAQSQNKEAAYCFIEWATSKSVMTKTVPAGNINPPRASVAASQTMTDYTKDWGDYNQVWQQNLAQYAKWRWNPSTDFDQVGNRWATAVQSVILGQASAADALNAAATDINAVLKP